MPWGAKLAKGGEELDVERVRKLWAASVHVRCDAGETILALLRRLKEGLTAEVEGEAASLSVLGMDNAFSPRHLHPTHLRDVCVYALLSHKSESVMMRVVLVHKQLHAHYKEYEPQ